MLGSDTQPLWVEVAAFLRSSVPDVEECTIDGVGHLLHIQRPEPVARAIAAFLGRHPIAGRCRSDRPPPRSTETNQEIQCPLSR